MSEELLEIITGTKPTFAVIWLHGLGADGSDFVAAVPELGLPDALGDVAQGVNRDIPIFAAHGTADDVVSLQLGEAARNFLKERGCRLEWHTYAMPHSVCLEELRAIGTWLQAHLQDKPAPAPSR